MSFEEQTDKSSSNSFELLFPELKSPIIIWNSGEWTREGSFSRIDDTVYKASQIQAHCLSKQRVKEAIERSTHFAGANTGFLHPRELLKELGLDDEVEK